MKIVSYVFWRVSLLRPEKKVLVVCLAGALEKKSSSHLSGGCAIVITTGKKVLVVCLAGAQSLLQPEIKSSRRLSGGCVIVITTGKKIVLVVCLAGVRMLLRPEKKFCHTSLILA